MGLCLYVKGPAQGDVVEVEIDGAKTSTVEGDAQGDGEAVDAKSSGAVEPKKSGKDKKGKGKGSKDGEYGV